jgi:hypothetical protein
MFNYHTLRKNTKEGNLNFWVPVAGLRTGNLCGMKFFPVLPRNPDSEQSFVRNKYAQEK